jgi:hypothetical protein
MDYNKEFLDDEKQLYNYFYHFQKLFNLILKQEKIRVEKVKKYHNIFRSNSNKKTPLMKKWFYKKKLISEEENIKEQLELLRKNIIHLLNREINFLSNEFQHIYEEEEIIKKIYNIPIFKALHKAERRMIEDLVYTQTDLFLSYFKQINNLKNNLIFVNQSINNSEIPNNTFIVEIEEIIKKNTLLMNCAKNLIKENKRILKEFNSFDLKESLKESEKIIRKYRDRAFFISTILESKRRLDKTLDPNKLICVHMTDYIPKNGVLEPTGNFNIFGHRFIPYKLKIARQTIHFCFNSVVGDHAYGNWKGKKYAILVPAVKIWNRLINITPNDTFIVGDLILPEGTEILALDNKEIKNLSSNISFYHYKDNDFKEAIIKRIKERGFTPLVVNSHWWIGIAKINNDEKFNYELENLENWIRNLSVEAFSLIAKTQNKDLSPHSGSLWVEIEDLSILGHGYLYEDILEKYKRITERPSEIIIWLKRWKESRKKLNEYPLIEDEEIKARKKMILILDTLQEALESTYPEDSNFYKNNNFSIKPKLVNINYP